MPDRAARRVLDAWIDRLDPATEEAARARWDAAREATPEHRARVEATGRALDGLRRDPEGFRRIEQSLAERLEDPVLRRALEALRVQLSSWQTPRPESLVTLEARAAEHFARFRAEVGGRRLAANEVAETLRAQRGEQVLERTWRAAIQAGTEIAETVREMARLRNEHARAAGHADFRHLRLAADEVDADRLEAFLETLARATDAEWVERKEALDERLAERFGRAPATLCPWHYGDVFLQTPPRPAAAEDPFAGADLVALARRTFTDIGLDVDAVLQASDLWPREGKNQHAFCTHLDRRGDVRVLANLEPSERWMRTLLHELGHAAYDLEIDRGLPWNLVRPPHAAVTEGVAMLFGRLADDAAWRARVAGLEAEPGLGERARDALLCFVRWGLVVSVFERHLYADPEADLDRLWWDLVERYQGIRRPDPLPVGAWAAKIHVACHPVYYHAYLLGECIASQLARRIRDEVEGGALVGNAAAGAWLRERVFRPGALRPWEDLVCEATGMALDPAALLHDALPATGRA